MKFTFYDTDENVKTAKVKICLNKKKTGIETQKWFAMKNHLMQETNDTQRVT